MKIQVKLALSALLLSIAGCVQQTHEKTIHFTVNSYPTEVGRAIGIRGDIQPLSWQETTLLTDEDGDGIYEAVLTFDTASNQLNFKFVDGDDSFELQGQNNRVLPFEYREESIQFISSFDSEEFEIIKNK